MKNCKKILSLLLTMLMVVSMLSLGAFLASADESTSNVAKVGNTEYATIDEAIANWTNGTTLTLLSDVTLSDVIKLSSTEYHILDLGTYTMTAAPNKDAIQYVVNGRGTLGYALDIKADATNPGGITATGGSVVRHTKPLTGAPKKDRPITRFYGGVFNASYVVRQGGTLGAGYTGSSAPGFQFYGGVYNGTIYTNRSQNQFHGGTFNGSMQMSVDSSAYTLVAGGTFKNLSNSLIRSELNTEKFMIASHKCSTNCGHVTQVYDKEVYIDENGNMVIAAAKPSQGIEAGVAQSPDTKYDYLAYSKVATEGQLNYTDVETALKNNTSATVTVYAEEVDMSGINFKGTIVVPEGETITIVTKAGASPAWTISAAGATVKYTDTEGNELVKGADGSFVEKITEVATYEELLAALEEGGKIKLTADITATATQSSGYGKAGIVVDAGDVLDGNGHKLTINGANATWDCVIAMKGGEVKNLTIAGAMRGVFMPGANGDVVIDNCEFKNVIYTFNSDAGSKDYTVTIKDTVINGWTSFSNVHKAVTFVSCTFGEGNGYAFCRPYQAVTFEDCAFEAGYEFDTKQTTSTGLVFENCTYAGEALSADNNAMFYNGGNVVIDGETTDVNHYVASVGTNKYLTLQAAIDAAQNGDTITFLADITENVTLTEKAGLYYTIDGNDQKFNGTMTISSLSDTNDNRRITIQNVNFVNTAETGRDFIYSVKDNHYPRLSVLGCTFTGNGKDTDVAIRTKSAYDLKIENCIGTGLHSFLQNTAGVKVTIKNVTITESKGGLALGTAQNVTVRDCEIETRTYGIRLDAVLNTSVTLNGNIVESYIPVSIRKTSATEYKLSFNGSASSYTATNTDGVWCAIVTDEYEDGVALNAPTGNVKITWNTDALDEATVYGAYEWPIHVVFSDGYTKGFDSLKSAMNFGYSGGTLVKIIVHKDITESMDSLEGNIVTDNPNGVTIKNTIVDEWIYCSDNFTIGEGVTYDASGYLSGLFVYADDCVIKGTVIVDCYYQRYADSKLTIHEPGSLTVKTETFILRYTEGTDTGIYIVGDDKNETVGLNASVIYFYQGVISAKDANIVVGTYWQTNETDGSGYAKLVLDNSTLTVTVTDHAMKATGNSTVTLTSGSSVSAAGGYTGVAVSADATSEFIVKGKSMFVAKVGNVKYTTLADAVADVKEGGTVTLIADVVFNTETRAHNSGTWYDGLYYVGDKSFTIDLNGFTITHDGSVNDYLLNFKNVGTKANTITIKNGTVDAGTAAYCAICTSATQENQLTINLENLNVINNISNGSTIKVRGGVILNVKSGTVITGKNSYLGIECIASTVNIYDGAKIYMNGTSSYNGCLVGVGSGGTVNVYGGYGKGVKGGFIAMTSGGTINISGGEWIANTDGSVGSDSNYYVLTAQSNKYEGGFVGASIINVTGGTFHGGMDAWVLNNIEGEKAELNISGGNFNANPSSYVETGYVAVKTGDVYNVVKAVAKIGDKMYASLQEAIAAITDGSTLTIFEGEYDAALVINKSNVTVIGEGNVTLNGVPSIKGTNYTVENINFVYSTGSTNLSGSGLIKDCTFTATAASGNAFRYCYGTKNATITFEGCTISAPNGWAIHFDSAPGLVLNFTDCEINGRVALSADLGSLNATETNFENGYVNVWGTEDAATFTYCEFNNVPYIFTGYDADNVVNFDNCDDAVIGLIYGGNDSAAAKIYVDGVLKSGAAKIGDVYYNTVDEAFAAAKNGDEVVILKAGTYKLGVSGKNITVTGFVNGVVFDNIGACGMGGASVTFNNVTFNYAANSTYSGLQHAGNLVYNNCIFNGQVFLYGASETFNNCTFNNTGDNYNVWTYGAKAVEFNGCTFNSDGKAVLIYTEGADTFNTVTVTDSTFKASAAVDGKAAIEMDSSLSAGIKLTVTNSTATGFGTGNVSGNSLWNNKKGNNTDANNDITVTVGGTEVLAPVTFVAKIGKIGYTSIAAAIKAANAGETVTILAGEYTENLNVNKSITVVGEGTVKFNGKLNITADGATVKNINVNNGSNSAGYINAKDVLVEGCTIVGGNGFRSCYTSGTVTFKDSTITGATYGIHFDGSAGGEIVIDNCVITGWTSFAKAIKKVTVTDTTFAEGNYNFVRFYQEEVIISGCTFNENMKVDFSVDGATVAVTNSTLENGNIEDLFYGSDMVNSTITVDGEKLVRVAKIGDVYYETIEAAINAANAGETVTILAGTYNTNINVNKAITVVGETDANGNNLVNISGKLNVTANGATVKNLNVNNGGSSAGYISAKDVLIEDCTIVGGNGFRSCYTSGTVTFKDSIITGATYGIHFDGSANGNIVIDNCVITGWTSFAGAIEKVTISNTTFAEGNYNQLRFYQDAELTNVKFNPEMTVDFGKNGVEATFTGCTVTDGSDLASIIYLPDLVDMGIKVKVGNNSVVALVNSKAMYTSLAEAFANAKDNDTIVLLADIALSETIKNTKKVTLDLNGKTIIGTDNATGSFSVIENKGELTITGNGTITLIATNNRGWNAYSSVISNTVGGKLIVENGTIEHLGGTDMAYGIDNLTNGKGTYAETVINGGTIKSTYRAIRQFLNGVEAQNILTINGGTIEGTNKSIWMQDPSKNANTGKLTVGANAVINGDIYLFVTAGSTEWPVEVSIAASAVTGEILTGNVPAGYITSETNGIYGVSKDSTKHYIYTLADLKAFRDAVNSGANYYEGVTVYLMADIDLAGENWVAIGSAYKDHGFMGNFDGNGFKIMNLTINNPAVDSDGYAYAGFFGVTEGTDKNNQNFIKNLVIENVTINTNGHIVAAAIAYPYYTTVSNITVCGDIAIKGGDYTAGVLAYTRRCVNASNLTISGNAGSYITGAQVVGGVISDIQMNGGLTANYSNFSASGLTITGTKMVGGISGIIATQTLNGATVKNVTIVSGDSRVGIVAGSLGGISTISNVTIENVTGATAIVGATYDAGVAVQAKIGDTYYTTLDAALKAAKAGDVIELLTTYVVEKGETKELNLPKDVTISMVTDDVKMYALILNYGNLTITGEGKLSYKYTGTDQSDAHNTIESAPGSVLTVKGGTIENLSENCLIAYAIDGLTNGNGGDVTVNIEGGKISSKKIAVRIFANSTTNTGNLNISGGEISGRVIIQSANANANKAALNITGGTFNTNGYKADVLYVGGTGNASGITASVSGGTFNGEILSTTGKGFISGGIFNAPVAEEFCVEGCIPTANADGTYGVKVGKFVARVNGVGYETIDAAIAAAQVDETVTILAGNYTTNISVNKAITVVGETDADGNNLVNISGKLNVTANDATVKNLNVNNGGSSAGYISAKDVLIEGCTIVGGNGFRSCYTSGTVTFKDSTITGATYGIHFDGSANGNIVIDNCVITGWTSFAKTIKKVTMTGTTFKEGNYNYIRFYQENVVINGCTFNEKMAIDLAVDGANATVTNSTLENGNVEDLFEGADIVNSAITVNGTKLVRVAKIGNVYYETIAAAIKAANAGETVTILAGEYTENLNVNKSITVVGEGTVKFNGKLNITANGATVKNLNVNNGGSSAGYISAKDVLIEGCTIVGGNGFRSCYTSGTVTFKDSTITGATYGIHFDGSDGGEIVIDNCEITGWTSFAKAIKKVTVTDTTFAEGNYNFVRFYQEEVIISGCTFNENMKVDFSVDGATVAVTDSTLVNGNIEDLFYGSDMVNSTITVDGEKLVRVAKIGDVYYETLADALAAVGEGDVVIELVADATLSYGAREAYGVAGTTSVTINGNGHTLTLNQTNSDWSSIGLANADAKLVLNNMTINKSGKGATSGAWNTHAIIFSCNVEMNNVTVNNSVAVQNGATLKDVTINEANGYYGLWINGNGQTVTMNGGSITATNGGRGIKIADEYVDDVKSVTLNVTGTKFNTAKKAAVLVSSKAGAAITASNVDITNVAADKVNFVWVDEDWAAYNAKVTVSGVTKAQEAVDSFVAQIGENYYKSLAAAITAAEDGATITLLWVEGDAPIAMNGAVYGKTVTITGTATVDWSKGFLFIGRGGEGNGTVIFDNAKLTSASDNASTGIHVSGREKNTNNKYDGTLIIKNSTIELDYLINKGTMTLDNSTLTVKNGFSVGGRPASETESGVDATATLNITNGSKVVVNNHNGMGLGYEAIGVMNIDKTSSFETTQSFLVTAKGTMNVNGGTVKIAGTLTNNGKIYLNDTVAKLISNECGNVISGIANYKVVYVDGVYKLSVKDYVAEVNGTKYETLADAIAAAQAGDTITFLADITENVTINKDLTIDGANFKYTGTMTANSNLTVTVQNVNFVNGGFDKPKAQKSTTGKYTIKECTFDGTGEYAYAFRFYGANQIVIEDCTVKDYLYSFLYVPSAALNVSVKNVTVENCPNYAVYFASGVTNATFEGLIVKNANRGFLINNTADRNFTITNCTMLNVGTAIAESAGDKSITCTVRGKNDFGTAAISQYANIVLADANATLTALAGLNVTTDVADHKVVYANGTYSVVAKVYVAEVNGVKYESLADAISNATDGATIVVLQNHELDGSKTVKDNKYGYDTLLEIDGKKLTIDFGSYTVSVTPNANSENAGLLESIIFLYNDAELTLKGEGGFNVEKGTKLYSLIYNSDSTLTIENGKYTVEELITSGSVIYADYNHITTINGGNFYLGNAAQDASNTTKPWIFNTEGKNDSFVNVNGGTFNQNILMNYGSAKDCEVVLKDGTCLHLYEGNGTWTVAAHSYTSDETAPTCTEKGYTTYTCACGDTYVSDYVDATGHRHTAVVTDPTCTEKGYTTYTCACGDTYVSDYVDATGHRHTAVVTAPTCTTMGYTTYTCACGDTYVSDYVSATGHNYVVVDAKAPTCKETGLTAGVKCSVCGHVLVEQSVVDKLAHTEVIIPAVAPTFDSVGYTEGKECSVCDEILVTPTEIPALTGAVAQIGETKYATLAEALAAAKENDTVVLLANVEYAGTLILNQGITLDLNGKTLTVDYLVAFNGNHVVDSTRGTGLLIVGKNSVVLASNNANMAVYTGEGYKFASAKTTNFTVYDVTETGFSVKFRPGLGSGVQEYLNTFDEVTVSGMQIIVRLTWMADGRTQYQDVVYGAKEIAEMYASTQALFLTVKNVGNYENLKATFILTSDTGVQVSQHMHTFNETTPAE